MCYQSIFPYDVITTQLNDEWVVWMDAKKEKAVFKGGHVIATQVNGCCVGARKGNETKESQHLKIISFCIRK